MGGRSFQAGDVFRLMPLKDGSHGFGQILASYGTSGGHFYFGVFRRVYSGVNPPVQRMLEDELVLLALSLDALLFHGHWAVVGHADLAENSLRSREYKVARAPGLYEVEEALGTTSRAASARDAALLPFRKVVAPIRLQRAFEALHGEHEWLPEYDELRA
jgi:hypothetical protein